MSDTDHVGLLGGLGHSVASLTVIPGATNTRGAAHKTLPGSTRHHLTVESSITYCVHTECVTNKEQSFTLFKKKPQFLFFWTVINFLRSGCP